MSIKAGDVFKIDQAWWKKNKPTTLKSTGLGKVISTYQAHKIAAIAMAKAGHYDNIDENASPLDLAMDSITNKLPAAVTKAQNDCNKTLHKDAYDCLKAAKSVLAAEAKVIAKLQDDFNRRYKRKQREFLASSKSAADENAASKQAAHDAYKNAEGELKDLAELAKKAAKLPLDKAREAAERASAAVMSITDLLEVISEMAKACEIEFRKVDGHLTNREQLTGADARVLIKQVDAAQVARNAVNTYRDKAALFLTTAQANLETIEKAIPSDSRLPPQAKDFVPRIKKLEANLGELCSRAREMNNTVVSFITNMRSMTKDPEAASKARREPVTAFPDYADMVEVEGPKFLDKIIKLKTQAVSMTNTVMKTVPRNLLADPLLKELIDEVKEQTQNLKDIVEGGAAKKNEMVALTRQIYTNAGY